jgi:hypothetical protein
MKSSTEQEDKKRPELFFGLVGAVGTDLALVKDLLVSTLSKYQYRSCVIRLSEILDNLGFFKDKLKDCPREDERIERHMDAGDELREKTGLGDALALLSLTKGSRSSDTVKRGERQTGTRYSLYLQFFETAKRS